MPRAKAKSTFKDEFTGRVAEARNARRLTQDQMAGLLGISQGNYKQYEGRSYLPHELVENFCLIVGCDIAWLYTGQGMAPAQIVTAAKENMPQKAGRRRRAA